MDKLKPRGLHFFYYTLDNNLNDINKMMTRLQINNVPDSFNFVDEVVKNPLLCFSYKIINYFDNTINRNPNNILLYLYGNYNESSLLTSVANISIKNITYIDPFEEEESEKNIKEIYINYFCGSKNYSAAKYLMLKIIDIMKDGAFQKIIIERPVDNAIEFYKSFGFKIVNDYNNKLELKNSDVIGGKRRKKRKTIRKRNKRKRKTIRKCCKNKIKYFS